MLPWAPPAEDRQAVVVDLPAAEAVEVGVSLARRGYRPVPLFNAAPPPPGVTAVIDTAPILRALLAGADALAAADVPDDAPPAFLLDARRKGHLGMVKPGVFDNRWVVLPQDLPSGDLLKARGIRGVLVVHGVDDAPASDLAHVLVRWQQAGLRMSEVVAGDLSPPREMVVAPPSRFRWLMHAALATLGLRMTDAGAFGGVVPHPSSGG